MSEDILVGCPVYKRAWILPKWFEHVERACERANREPVYVFVVDDRDSETLNAIHQHEGGGFVIALREPVEHDGERHWDLRRYAWMAELRNELLAAVRREQPSYFLSVDSDILLHPDALTNLLETIQECDAVGGKTYLSEMGTYAPNWGTLGGPSNGLKRYDAHGVFTVQVLMALKLMTPAAYAVDYVGHEQGEDIGWSLACANQGLRLKWDGRVASKHVMHPRHLDLFDKRVGF